MDTRDHALTTLAERQHGLVADRQVAALGLTREAWRHRERRGEWERLGPGVVRRRGAPMTDEQEALAAVLDVGPSTYASHEAAAALWGVPGCRLAPMHVMTLRPPQSHTPLAIVHHPRHLPEPFATSINGVPVVRPALMLLQMAARVHPDRLARMLDGLWSRRLLSAPSVRAELAPLMHRGRAGTAALRALLDSLPEDYVPAASNLEARFARILAEAGLPAMRRQVDLGDRERWCGRVDFVAVEVPLIVEIDSGRYHRALTDRAADDARQVALQAAGFLVVRISEHDVWHGPAAVVAAVAAARRVARRARAA